MTIINPEAGAPAGKPVGAFIVSPTDRWSVIVPLGTPATGVLTIHNTAAQPLKIKRVIPGGEKFKVSLTPVEEGKSYSINFSSVGELPIGLHQQTIRIETDNAETPVVELPLQMSVVAPVTANPVRLAFENMPVSTPDYDVSSYSKFTWVRVNRGEGLELTKLSSDLPFITAKIESVQGNKDTYLLRVGFSSKPTPGTHRGTLRIETNHKAVPVIEVAIYVTAK